MKRLYIILFMAFMLVAPTAQAGIVGSIASKIKIERIERVTHLSSTGANVWVEMTNDTHLRLVAKFANVEIFDNGKSLGVISLRDKVVLRRNRTETVLVPLRFESRSSFALLKMLRLVLKRDAGLTISYNLRGGISVYKRTISAENIAISKFLDKFAISNSVIEDLISKL
ncbi:MAG: hypothetical protein IJZ50_07290 [Alistipes sp.]|nr:hypothetical protein [Alistipes sp.]